MSSVSSIAVAVVALTAAISSTLATASSAAWQEPQPAATAPAPAAQRVGGNIKAPQQIKKVSPVYPLLAQQARIAGVVILEALIGPDGKVRQLKVLRSVPFLDGAAIDAVRQWEYTPTLIAGTPTPIIMTVTVTFTLNGNPPPVPLIATAWASAAGVPRAGRDVPIPRQTKNVRAAYPVGAQVERRAGAAILELLIGADGKVKDVRSLRPTPEFDESAMEATRRWEYEPTLVNGVAVPVVLPTILTFSIKP